jgi:hypothetical protein
MRVVIGHALPMTMREVMVPAGEQNGAETKFESFARRGYGGFDPQTLE